MSVGELPDSGTSTPGNARSNRGTRSHGRPKHAEFLFYPVANLSTGAVVGVEMRGGPRLPRPTEVLDGRSRGPRSRQLDTRWAAAALRWAVDAGVRAPIHLNLRAETVAGPPEPFEQLHTALCETRTLPGGVIIEIGALHNHAPAPEALLAGARRLRERGYGVLVDGLTTHDPRMPLVLAGVADQVKLHPDLLTGLTDDAGLRALMSVVGLCRGAGAEVIADGIATVTDLEPLRAQGVRRGQGPLLAAPGGRPAPPLLGFTRATTPTAPKPVPDAFSAPHTMADSVADTVADTGADTVAAFAGPATMLSQDVTGGQVREVFRDHRDETVVVLVDTERQPVGSLDRNRFMLAMSGQFGHALHCSRPALRMADQPRVLPGDASARTALDMLATGEPARRNDDIVVIDGQGRCVGVAHVTDLLRGLAETAYQRALTLDPATRLNGLALLRPALVRRISRGLGFVAGWLVPELGPMLEHEGFAAGETAMRTVAQAIQTAVDDDPDAQIGHVLGGLVVLTTTEHATTADRAVRRILIDADGPDVCSAWLICPPGTSPTASEVESTLAAVLAQAKAQGSGTTLTSVLEPHRDAQTGHHGGTGGRGTVFDCRLTFDDDQSLPEREATVLDTYPIRPVARPGTES